MNEKKFHEWLDRWIIKDLPIKVFCIVIALFIYNFHRDNSFDKKTFRVRLEVKSTSNMVVKPGSRVPQWILVTVRGNKDQLAGITEDDIEVFVDISQQMTTGVFSFPVYCEPKDRLAHVDPLEIHHKPENVELDVEEEIVRYVNLTPEVSGQPAHGYERTSVELNPSNIAIRGPKSIVEGLESLATEKLDIDGITADLTKQVEVLNTDKRISVLHDNSVDITVKVTPVISTRTLENLSIVYENLSPSLEIRSRIYTVNITVEGEQLVLERLRNTSFYATADCSLLKTAGTFPVQVFIFSPEEAQVIDQSVSSINVTVAKKYVEPPPAPVEQAVETGKDAPKEEESELPAESEASEGE